MNINKRIVKMLDTAGRKVTVRESRLQIYLDLGWTVGWPEDEVTKDEQRTESADQQNVKKAIVDKEIPKDPDKAAIDKLMADAEAETKGASTEKKK